jgi:hypothetical protein
VNRSFLGVTAAPSLSRSFHSSVSRPWDHKTARCSTRAGSPICGFKSQRRSSTFLVLHSNPVSHRTSPTMTFFTYGVTYSATFFPGLDGSPVLWLWRKSDVTVDLRRLAHEFSTLFPPHSKENQPTQILDADLIGRPASFKPGKIYSTVPLQYKDSLFLWHVGVSMMSETDNTNIQGSVFDDSLIFPQFSNESRKPDGTAS